jgi:hypothetical protein
MSRTMNQLVRLITMMLMLVAGVSARIASTSDQQEVEEHQEHHSISERRLTGCDTGAACGCPDNFTKLYLLDVPTVCVPLEVSDIIFLVFVPFLTCCATPLVTAAAPAEPGVARVGASSRFDEKPWKGIAGEEDVPAP